MKGERETTKGGGREPLAARMRPRTLDEFIGQDHIIGVGRLLRRAIEADMIASVIFYGPPGTGKTTLARIIAHTTKKAFAALNAVLGGVKEVRHAVEEAQKRHAACGQGTILFVDEVHRWNKAQQDALLPWVESGVVSFVGATTHNPFFEINNALLSRSRIFRLRSLTEGELRRIMEQALGDRERGYGAYAIGVEPEAEEHIIKICNGDARSLLNALQLAVENGAARFPPLRPDEKIVIDLSTAEESIQKKAVLYDRDGDYHYDHISAFIKSVRGSDPDAALYWMAKMVYGGEDPRFIFRRLLILAAEDIGLADPHALVVTEAAAAAFEMIGLPEGQFHLSQATLYCALAEKSNSALAYFDALKAVEREESGDPPDHLKDASRDKREFGHGKGYRYPHAYSDHWVAQQYLPDSLKGRLFYTPGAVGFEGRQREKLLRFRALQLPEGRGARAADNIDGDGASPVAPRSRSRPRRRDAEWLERVSEERIAAIRAMCAAIFGDANKEAGARLAADDTVYIAGHGIRPFVWGAMQRVAAEGVVAHCLDDTEYQELAYHIKQLPPGKRPQLRRASAAAAETPAAGRHALAMGAHRSRAFMRGGAPYADQWAKWTRELVATAGEGGYVAVVERLPHNNLSLSDALRDLGMAKGVVEMTIAIERCARKREAMYAFDQERLAALLTAEGCEVRHCEGYEFAELRSVDQSTIGHWLLPQDGNPPDRRPFATAAAATLTPAEITTLHETLTERLCGAPIRWPVRYTVCIAQRV